LYRFSNLHRISGAGQLRVCQLEVLDAFTSTRVDGVGTWGTLDVEARAPTLDATRDDRRTPTDDIATRKEPEEVAANAEASCRPDWVSPRRDIDELGDGEEKARELLSKATVEDFTLTREPGRMKL
jgi:hypothetical protein